MLRVRIISFALAIFGIFHFINGNPPYVIYEIFNFINIPLNISPNTIWWMWILICIQGIFFGMGSWSISFGGGDGSGDGGSGDGGSGGGE